MAESLKRGQEKKATMKGSLLILLLSVVMLMYGIIGLSLDSKIPLLLCTLVMMFWNASQGFLERYDEVGI